ncbi:MarR family winged helix-turn-helix transcriptional regulator [Solibacillus isronensis]|uniref:MarR family winged helix-turn-helix transcriptional regulator n=1 Tax=Solibacillus isronensis TaxID=412383 RepID=UPI00203CB023|nr:MarR family transcriptional regulator [Solibacillus isronensis]MCM3721943.1 MarR family transcriptional regulator [Solibacillus isronensis]
MIDFIELLYRQHKQLRQKAEIMWNENNDLHITSSEWFVLKNIYEGYVTVPELVKQLDISKQGVHKFVTSLQEKKLITTELIKGSKVQKMAHLTEKGIVIFNESKKMELEIEKMVRDTIGDKEYELLLEMLKKPLLKI